ncbi:hypothetical protein FSARC_13690 [Fusarium sarcochroum]|uniref:Uncharacterized protein n=1 Tax=Fusarium sarcochroum TaxID=1208366 RepID=A0A8H4SZP8_9HYPO|nr:hypothetical protein FSARC_13690 [Fusarium sarcochroum]
MSTPASLNVYKTTPAVIAWQWNNETRSLAEPDPPIKSITLTTRFDATNTFFELSIPIRLKGIKTSSSIILRIPPSSIAYFDFVQSMTVPDTVRDKFDSTTLCLNFQLNEHLKLLLPVDVHEPLSPMRTHSGRVFDAIRELANVTSLFVYVEASRLSNAQLQSIGDAIDLGSLPPASDDLASMYGGTGAKIIALPASADLPPPSYDEAEPPPPSAPIYDRKRPRKDDRDERDEDIALIWAQLQMMQKDHVEEKKALRRENEDLKQEIHELRERLTTFEKYHESLKEEFGALEATTEHKTVELGEEIDIHIAELKDDLQELRGRVDYIREEHDEDELVDRAKDKVLDHIRTRLSVD